MSCQKKILVADDDAGIQFMMRRLLEKKGYEVLVANSGEDCLKKVASETPHLIVLDIAMPGAGGIGALEKLKKNAEWKDIPVILISGDPSHERTQVISRLGGDDFLAKPFKSDDLVSRISKHLIHLDLASLKTLLFQLRTRDAALSALAGFAADRPIDVYPATFQSMPVLILLPPGFESKDARSVEEAGAAQKVQVVANLGFSWKKLWPHPARELKKAS